MMTIPEQYITPRGCDSCSPMFKEIRAWKEYLDSNEVLDEIFYQHGTDVGYYLEKIKRISKSYKVNLIKMQ